MTRKTYSQTSRDRMVANMLIAIPVAVLLGLVRYYQGWSASEKEATKPL